MKLLRGQRARSIALSIAEGFGLVIGMYLAATHYTLAWLIGFSALMLAYADGRCGWSAGRPDNVLALNFDASEIMSSITVRFTVTGLTMLRWRVPLAVACWRLGAFIAGTGVEIDCRSGEESRCDDDPYTVGTGEDD